MRVPRRRLPLLWILLAALARAMPAVAQDTAAATPLPPPLPASEAPESAPNTARQLETIVVTAQKREESAQAVPLSVTPIRGKTLRDSGTFDASGIEAHSPNLEINLDAQDPIISIRGFTSDPNNVGFEPAVGLEWDDVSLGRSEFISDGLYDIGRIEVLRGPQGTLFGKNTIAGVISFRTVEPGADWNGRLLTAQDDLGSQHVELGQNVPLGRSSALRVAGTYGSHAGEIENSKLGRKEDEFIQKAGRVKFIAAPMDALTVRVSSQISQTGGTYAPIQLYDLPPSVLAFGRKYDPAFEDNPLDRHTSEDTPGFVNRDSNVTQVALEYDFGGALGTRKLTSTLIAGYAKLQVSALIDADDSPAALVETDYGLDHQQRSLEWRVNGESGSLFGIGHATDFVFGLFALQTGLTSRLDQIAGDDLVAFAASPAGFEALGAPDISMLQPLFSALPTAPGVPIDDRLFRHFSQSGRSLAGFGQATWNFWDGWSAILGLRVTRDDKRGTFHVATEGPGILATIVGAQPFDATLHRSEGDASPKVGLSYRWSDAVTMFLSATRGYEGGGYNADANTSDDLQFDAEKCTSFEGGLKATWLRGRLRTNLSAYDTEVSNLQVVFLEGNSLEVGNAAKVRLRGLEAEASWLPGFRWLRLDAAIGVSQAQYLDYRDAVPTDAQSDGGQKSQDLTGRTLPNAPDLSMAFSPSLRWPLPFGRNLGLEFAVNAVYRGAQYSATNLDPHTLQQGYWLLGSSLFLGRQDHRYGLLLSGRNLADRKALDMARDNAVYHDSYETQQIDRRILQVSLLANW